MDYDAELSNNNDDLMQILNDIQNLPEAVVKPNVFTSGNVPVFDNNGNIQDSGKSINNIQDGIYAPMYIFGTEDLVAGSSPLEHGKLYFVYE